MYLYAVVSVFLMCPNVVRIKVVHTVLSFFIQCKVYTSEEAVWCVQCISMIWALWWFKGAVCHFFLAVQMHKNTIICLQIFRKHTKFTYSHTKNNATFYFEVCIPCQDVCFCFSLCDSSHYQFTQYTLGCQLVENTAYCSNGSQQTSQSS